MKQKLTKEQKKILALFKAGFSYREIAQDREMSVSSVHYILNGRKGKYRKFKGVRHLSTEKV